MSVKKVGIIVLACLVGVFAMSPALTVAGEPATASAGAAGSAGAGATNGLNTLSVAVAGAFVIFVIAGIASGFFEDDDIPPTQSAHHGH